MPKRSVRLLAVAIAMLVPQAGTAAAATGPAHAHATAADDVYGGGGVLGGNAGGGAGGVLGESSGSLPFTGANLLLILGSGVALVGIGAGARVASRRA
jgi:hypothetical protein